LTLLTLWYTRQTAISAVAATRAAVRAAGISERSLVDIERGFVFPAGFTGIALTNEAREVLFWRIGPQWQNSGNTPTRGFYNHVSWKLFPADGIPDGFAYVRQEPTLLFVGPRATITGQQVDISSPSI
jgi:hypothetical protein